MLTTLRIRNLAVLRDATLSLTSGLNVISGETGAGKSLVTGALELLLGGRATGRMVRAGEEKGVVEGVARVEGLADLVRALDGMGLEAEDNHLLIRREIRRRGNSRAWVNGSPATMAMLRTIGRHLIDIHGQNEHQRLLSTNDQQRVLDAFGQCTSLAAQVAAHARRIGELEERLRTLSGRRRELESRADFIRFRLAEIQDAKPGAGEDDALEAEAARLMHADRFLRETGELVALLHERQDSVNDQLAAAADRLRRMAAIDAGLLPSAAALEDVWHRVTDVSSELRAYRDAIDHDPRRLEEIQARQALLQRLRRKYGPTLDEVIETGAALARELDELEGSGLDARGLEGDLEGARAAWKKSATGLSVRRREAANQLEREVEAAMPALGLRGGRFRVEFEEMAVGSARGMERVRFLATMNPGFPPAPLADIASGGELARMMLALKSILAGIDDLPTLVFDEIDAGIGGGVAGRVGARLEDVARSRQVVAITHLARIAARAVNHIAVRKGMSGGVAETTLVPLDEAERVREIARMLGGDPDSQSSLEHARELLESRSADHQS